MGSGAPAAEVVVVHAGEIIVNERISVHHLDGAGGSEGVFCFAPAGLGGGEGEDGAETFPPGKDRVAHGLVNGPGRNRDLGKDIVEGVIDEFELALEVVFEIGHGRKIRMIFSIGELVIA